MKLSTLLNSGEALRAIGAAPLADANKTFSLARMLKEIREHVETYEEARKAYLSTYGEDQGGGRYSIPDDKRKEFAEHMDNLEAQEVELQHVVELKRADIAGNNLGAAHLAALDWFIDLDE